MNMVTNFKYIVLIIPFLLNVFTLKSVLEYIYLSIISKNENIYLK